MPCLLQGLYNGGGERSVRRMPVLAPSEMHWHVIRVSLGRGYGRQLREDASSCPVVVPSSRLFLDRPAYSAEQVLLNKPQVYGGPAKLHWYQIMQCIETSNVGLANSHNCFTSPSGRILGRTLCKQEASQGYSATYNHNVMNSHISLEPQSPWPDLWTGPSDWARAGLEKGCRSGYCLSPLYLTKRSIYRFVLQMQTAVRI